MGDRHHAPVTPVFKELTPETLKRASRIHLRVWGMRCPNCAARVHNALLSLRGVWEAEIDLRRGHAYVYIDEARVDPQDLVDVVRLVGQEVGHVYEAVAAA